MKTLEKLRRYNPLPADHPAVGTICDLCGFQIKEGDITTLIPFRMEEPFLAEAKLVHSTCAVVDGWNVEGLE